MLPPSLDVMKPPCLTTTMFVPSFETATSSSPLVPRLLSCIEGKIGEPAPAASAPEGPVLARPNEAVPPEGESGRFGEFPNLFSSCWTCAGSPTDSNTRLRPIASTVSLSSWSALDGRSASSRTSSLSAATAVVIWTMLGSGNLGPSPGWGLSTSWTRCKAGHPPMARNVEGVCDSWAYSASWLTASA